MRVFSIEGKARRKPAYLTEPEKKDVFIGGDVKRIGFMVDAMADGRQAADSIDRYLRGVSLGAAAVDTGGVKPLRESQA